MVTGVGVGVSVCVCVGGGVGHILSEVSFLFSFIGCAHYRLLTSLISSFF